VPFLGHPVCATARLNVLSLRSLNANHSNRDLSIADSLKKTDLLTLETIGAYRVDMPKHLLICYKLTVSSALHYFARNLIKSS